MSELQRVLKRKRPRHIIYSPNYRQWFEYHKNNETLPNEVNHCKTMFEFLKYLEVDIFSSDLYYNQRYCWFGGLAVEQPGANELLIVEDKDGEDILLEKTYKTQYGNLSERLRYVQARSKLLQEKFLVDDYKSQLLILKSIVEKRAWQFQPEKYVRYKKLIDGNGAVIAGELFSPLKMLHMTVGPKGTNNLLGEYSSKVETILVLHEKAQYDLATQMLLAGVTVLMSMDAFESNECCSLDQFEKYCIPFYFKMSRLCHEHGALFFINTYGNRKSHLKLISSLGVDGIEGLTPPPIGDMDIDEALDISGPHFIIKGGINALKAADYNSQQAFAYLKGLIENLKKAANRVIISSDCDMPVNTDWDVIKAFRDAWLEYGCLE